MSPLITLAAGLLTLAALAAVAALLEGIAARRRQRILDETLPAPEWHCRRLRDKGWVAPEDHIKVLTSCPSCMIGLNRFQDDVQNGLLEADYIVVEMAKKILGDNWMVDYVKLANAGGIERVLV